MRKINLQMFAYDPNSIVDYLKSTGQDSSYSARKELAKSLGISNYSGSGAQNTQMLNALKNSAASSTASSKPSSSGSSSGSSGSGSSGSSRPKGAPADAPSYTETGKEANYYTKENPYVVPSSNKNVKTSTKEITPFTQSGESQSASQNAKDKLAALDKFDVEDIISQETWDAINTKFSASSAYQDAMNYTNELLQQLSTGRTSYTDQIKDMLDQIQNRDKFSYDLSNDTLFQQSLASAMASGKTAMQDTMGQAAALTGGYGSTYATSAANQAYNAYIQDAYNNLPEYYELALQAYQMEGDEMYNQLSALTTADASEYERMYNSWNSNFQNAQQMYQNEYTAWQDSIDTALKNAGLQMDEFSTKYDQAYKTYQANQNYADTLYAQEFNKWSAEEDIGLSYAQMAQNQSQYDSDLKYKYDALAQDMKQYEKDLALQYEKLAQDQAQFNANLAAKKGSGNGGKADKTSDGNKTKDNLSATDIQKNVNTWLNVTGEFDDEDAMKYIKEYMDYGAISTGTAKKILDEVGVDLDDWDEFYEYQTTGEADQKVNTTLGYRTDASGNYITASGSKVTSSQQQTHKQKALKIVREEGSGALDIYLASLGLDEEKDIDYLYSIIEYVDKYSN